MFLTQFSVIDFSLKTDDKSPIGPMEVYMSSLPGSEADSESPGEDNTSKEEISKGNRNNEDENSLRGGKSSLGTDESETNEDENSLRRGKSSLGTDESETNGDENSLRGGKSSLGTDESETNGDENSLRRGKSSSGTDESETNEDENSLRGGKSSLGTDESETKRDTADEGKKDSSNGHRPGVKDNERPSGGGTSSKTQPLKRDKHFKIKSTELRWNVARDFGTQIEDKRKTRVKRRRKSGSEQRTEKHQTDDSRHDPDESGSPIIIAAVCAGMLVLLCMLTGLVRLWYVFNSCSCL